MRAGFSEFTYGFALTNEIVETFRNVISGAPILPSLIEEGRTGGGYDINIGIYGQPIFLQFKLSNYLTRKNASEWILFSSSYYRFNLMPLKYSQQHNMLIDLENMGNEVYYSAPIFHQSTEINNYFINRKIIDNSIFITPKVIGQLPDNNEHYIVFQNNPTVAYMCSEPSEISCHSGEKFKKELDRSAKGNNRKFKINNETLISLGKKMLLIASEKTESFKEDRDKLEKIIGNLYERPFAFVSNISRTLFGCEFLIICEDNEE